ncbi:serine-rich and transmembrane domain-containing protein 1 isoform X1 [Taeniopygia guttata]|uniref:serine-rich and transmembrane domain-containing protein 1 isoform X1 n=1 Tax=Taeniopygia guttata TaxID=59729 RepID=UPI003BB8C11F
MRICTMPGDFHPLTPVRSGAHPTPRGAQRLAQRVRWAGPSPCPSAERPARRGPAALPGAGGGPGAALRPWPRGTAAGAGAGAEPRWGAGSEERGARSGAAPEGRCGREGAALPAAPEPEHPEREHPGGVSRLLFEGGGRSGFGVFFPVPALTRCALFVLSVPAEARRARLPGAERCCSHAPAAPGPLAAAVRRRALPRRLRRVPEALGSCCAPWNSSRRASPLLLLRGSIFSRLPVLCCDQGHLIFTSV